MHWPLRGRDEELRRGVQALRRGSGCVVVGPPYVGSTRLLDEMVALAFPQKAAILRLRGAEELADVPYGVLGDHAPVDGMSREEWVQATVGDAPHRVVVVDESQLIDDATAGLLFHVVQEQLVVLALSGRRGLRAPDALYVLWRTGMLELVPLERLTREACDRLVEDALQGTVQRPLLQEVWDLSRGYPLLIRELVEGGVETGTIVERPEGWAAISPLDVPVRLVETVRHHLYSLDHDARESLHLIALGEPLEPEVVDELVPNAALRALEERELVTVESDRGGYVVAAPALCMAIRAYLLPSELRRLSRRLWDRLGGDESVSPVRRARWALDAAVAAPRDLFVAASEESLESFGHAEAERFARAVREPDPRCSLLLARALVGQEHAQEARLVLEQASATVEEQACKAELALTQSQVLFFHLGLHDEAINLLIRTADELTDPEWKGALVARLSALESLVGSPRRAVELCEPLWGPGQPEGLQLKGIVAATWPLTMIGRVDDVLTLTERGTALARRVGADPADLPLLEMTATIAGLWCGHVAESITRARDRYQRSLSHDSPGMQGTWAAHLAAALLFGGRLSDAAVRAAEACELLEVADPYDLRAGAYAQVSMVAACRGHTAAAERAEARMWQVARGLDHRHRHVGARVGAMLAAARGELEVAAAAAVARGRESLESEHLTMGALTIYQAVRFGYPGEALPLLDELRGHVSGELVQTWWRHADALADGDAPRLESAAERLLALDALLWGAEAYAQAAGLYAAAGRPALAASARARAGSLRERTGARTPALVGIEHEALTKREREIALMAADGLTSREIGERLHVSVRTVDNHLASVYRKLGVSGRHDLARALAVDIDPSP